MPEPKEILTGKKILSDVWIIVDDSTPLGVQYVPGGFFFSKEEAEAVIATFIPRDRATCRAVRYVAGSHAALLAENARLREAGKNLIVADDLYRADQSMDSAVRVWDGMNELRAILAALPPELTSAHGTIQIGDNAPIEISAVTVTLHPPGRIYLQTRENGGTWCEDKTYDDDTEYVPASSSLAFEKFKESQPRDQIDAFAALLAENVRLKKEFSSHSDECAEAEARLLEENAQMLTQMDGYLANAQAELDEREERGYQRGLAENVRLREVIGCCTECLDAINDFLNAVPKDAACAQQVRELLDEHETRIDALTKELPSENLNERR